MDITIGVIIILLQVATLGIALLAVRKLMWTRRASANACTLIEVSSRKTTQQLEALDGLYYRLGLERGSLPPSRGWAASPDFLNILYEHIQACRPRNLLECGSGLTTIITARALQQIGPGKLISLEHNKTFAEQTLATLKNLGLGGFVELHHVPLTSVEIAGSSYRWYDLENLSLPDMLDLIIVDGPPFTETGDAGRYPVGPLLFDRLSDGAAVLFDDSARSSEESAIQKCLAEFPHFRREDLPAEKGCVRLTKS